MFNNNPNIANKNYFRPETYRVLEVIINAYFKIPGLGPYHVDDMNSSFLPTSQQLSKEIL